jgi:prevent-host-death family protein
MNVSATEAKNRLGQMLEKAQTEPVFIEKAGRRHSVLLSVEQYEQLVAVQGHESAAQRKRRFYEQYKDWIETQNRHVEQYGVFGEEHRPW